MRVLQCVCLIAAAGSGVVAFGQQSASSSATGVVTGHVTCSDTQKPARSAKVSLVGVATMMTKDGASRRLVQTKTSLDGSFLLQGLAAGDYYAVATMVGYVLPLSADENWQPGKPNSKVDTSKVMANFPVVHVAAHRTSSLDLTLKHGAVIAGKITFDDGSPAAGLGMMVTRIDGQLPLEMYLESGLEEIRDMETVSPHTDDAGQYRVSGLPPGKYKVLAILETQQPTQEIAGERTPDDFFSEDAKARQNLFVYAPGVFKETEEKVVEIRGDEVSDGVDVAIRLDGLHAVRGRVLALSDRHPLSRVNLFLKGDAGFASQVVADPDGSFHFDYIPEGAYNLFLWGRDIKPGVAPGMEEENAHVYKRVNATVIVTSQDLVLDDFLLAEPEKPNADKPATDKP